MKNKDKTLKSKKEKQKILVVGLDFSNVLVMNQKKKVKTSLKSSKDNESNY